MACHRCQYAFRFDVICWWKISSTLECFSTPIMLICTFIYSSAYMNWKIVIFLLIKHSCSKNDIGLSSIRFIAKNIRNSIPYHNLYMTLKIPLYALVWKLSYDLEREIKFLKHFTVLVRLIGIWSRPKDENVLPEYTSQKIGLDLKISSLITSFHQTQFIWKANYLAKLSSSRHLFEKLIFFLANITQIHPRIRTTNSYTHKLLPLSSVWHAKLLFRDFIFSSGFMLSLFIKKSSLFQKQTSREDIISWQYLHIF